MNEFIEKLIGRLEELYDINDEMKKKAYEKRDWENFDLFTHGNEGVKESIAIVNQLAEEYNGGWIPYATGAELPLNNQKVWLSFTSQYTSFVKSAWWVNDHFEWNNGRTVKDVPLAWKPYNVPTPYQPKGE